MIPSSSELLGFALEYLERGWSVIPLKAKGKSPIVKWKEFQERYPTEEELKKWFGKGGCNIGVVTGKISGLIVLDIDNEEKARKINFPRSATVKTARGNHIYFGYSGEELIPCKKLPEYGIDIKGEGGIVVLPPSIHPCGIKYEWQITPDEIIDLPPSILELIKGEEFELGKGDLIMPVGLNKEIPELSIGVPEGQRNDTCTRLAGKLIYRGFTKEQVIEILLQWNKLNKPPMSEQEVLSCIDSIWSREQKKLRDLCPLGAEIQKTSQGYLYNTRKSSKFITNFILELEEDVQIVGAIEEQREFKGKIICDKEVMLFTIRAQDFADNRKFAQELQRQGGAKIIFDQKHLSKMREAVLYHSSPQEKVVYTTFGYHNGEFLSPSVLIREGRILANIEKRVELPVPLDLKIISEAESIEVIRHLKDDFLELVCHQVSYSLMGHIHLAPLFSFLGRVERYSLWLIGESGVGKTFIARLAQCFFGDFRSEQSITSWGSTPNYIQRRGYFFNSAIYVVDDFKHGLHQSKQIVAILQQTSDSVGRGRLRPDASERPTYYIRGLLLCTGQDLPEHEDSVLARSIIVAFPNLTKQIDKGRRCLRFAENYPGYVAYFIAWSQRKGAEFFKKKLNEIEDTLRPNFLNFSNGERITYNFSLNLLGFWAMTQFWLEMGVLTEELATSMYEEHEKIIGILAKEMENTVQEERGSAIFLRILTQLVSSGKANVKGLSDNDNKNAQIVGYLENEKIYLFPDLAYQEVCKVLQQSGRSFLVSKNSLGKQLKEDGFLLETDNDRTTKRKRRDGVLSYFWVMSKESIEVKKSIIPFQTWEEDEESRWKIP